MSLAAAVADPRAARRETVRSLVDLRPSRVAEAASWRGVPVDVRFLLPRLANDDLMRTVRLGRAPRAAGHQPSEAQAILAAAHAAEEELRDHARAEREGLAALLAEIG